MAGKTRHTEEEERAREDKEDWVTGLMKTEHNNSATSGLIQPFFMVQ